LEKSIPMCYVFRGKTKENIKQKEIRLHCTFSNAKNILKIRCMKTRMMKFFKQNVNSRMEQYSGNSFE